MPARDSSSGSPPRPRQGILLLTGYALRIAVERGHMVVEDGVGTKRRTARFPRPTPELRRVVVLGHSGTISFDALRWLSEVGAGFVQIDHDGRVIAATGPIGLQDARLRREQALAVENGRGLAIAKRLIREKLERQAALLDRLEASADAKAVVCDAARSVKGARSIEELRGIEAEGALAYWNAWAAVEVQFARRDGVRVPDHWRHFSRRSSALTRKPRKATNPANAILNYLYAIVEAEARLACLAVGCDPGLGVMHADQQMRDSLALDLMEPVRPRVDTWVLDLLEHRTFRRADFFETRQGVCRVMPPVTKLLAETGPRWTAEVAPLAERMVRELLGGGARRRRDAVPTPLTQTNRSKGRNGVRSRPAKNPQQNRNPLAATCVVCGDELPRRGRRFCSTCKPVQTQEAVSKAADVLRARRAEGTDPAHGGEAARRRGKRNSAAQLANAAWEGSHSGSLDPEVFRTEIAPGLRELSLASMMKATGLSRPYCAMIRRGAYVPHPRHWEALRALAEQTLPL